MSPDELIELRQRVTSSRSASVARRAANAPRVACASSTPPGASRSPQTLPLAQGNRVPAGEGSPLTRDAARWARQALSRAAPAR
jgi:hypothetical protein